MDTITHRTIQRRALVVMAAAFLASTAFFPSAREAKAEADHPRLPGCSSLANLLSQNKDLVAMTSAVQPAADGDQSYCLVNITVSDLSGPKDGYLPGQKEMIRIGIGLPLSAADGGSGGVQGNWNGRIQDLGGGGYVGSVGTVTSATDTGYVGSSTDTGHELTAPLGGALDASFALNPDSTLNWGLIRDFAFNGIHEQAVWTRIVTQLYYGMNPKYTYWNGCSTGGRQGHQQAQKYPNDFDGILAGDSAFNWDRFIPSELWGQIVMNQEVGAPISATKLNAVTQAAINACENKFNNQTDGIIQDPRSCLYDANAFVCGQPAAPNDPTMCLKPKEAELGQQDLEWSPGASGRPASLVRIGARHLYGGGRHYS